MIVFAYCVFFGFLSLFCDLLGRSANLLLCASGIFIYCIGAFFGPFAVILSSIIVGSMLDFLCGYEYSFSFIAFGVIGMFSYFASKRLRAFSVLLTAAAGFLIPLLMYLPQMIANGSLRIIVQFFPHLFLSSLLTAVFLPFFLFLFNAFNEKLEIKTRLSKYDEEDVI